MRLVSHKEREEAAFSCVKQGQDPGQMQRKPLRVWTQRLMGAGVFTEGRRNTSESLPAGIAGMCRVVSLLHSYPYLYLNPFSPTACGFRPPCQPAREGPSDLPVCALCPMTSQPVLQLSSGCVCPHAVRIPVLHGCALSCCHSAFSPVVSTFWAVPSSPLFPSFIPTIAW